MTNWSDRGILVNAFSNQAHKFEDKRLATGDKMREVVELSDCGLSIPSRILVKYMGSDGLGQYLREREEFFDNWKGTQYSHKDFPI